MSLRTGDRTECPQGHKYDEKNTYVTPRGTRRCKRCNNDQQMAKRRAAGMQPRNAANELRRKRLSEEGHIAAAMNRKFARKTDLAWHDQALCKGLDTNLFFAPDSDDFPDRYSFRQALSKQEKNAKLLCVGCPVMQQCRADNLMEDDGVFGGLTPSDRRRMVKRSDRVDLGMPLVLDDPNHVPVVLRDRRSRDITEETEGAIIEAYRAGEGYKAVAREVGVHHSTVRRVIEKNGLKRNPQEQAEAYDRAMAKRAQERDAKIRESLLAGMKPLEIHKEFGIGSGIAYTIQTQMRQAGELPPGDGRDKSASN